MILKISYNNNSISLVEDLLDNQYPNVIIETYNEDIFKERKDAFAIKGSWGARETPFAILLDDSGKGLKAFYSEAKECTFDLINNSLISYE